MELILASSTGVNNFWSSSLDQRPSSDYTVLPPDCLWRNLVAHCLPQAGRQPHKSSPKEKKTDDQVKPPPAIKPVGPDVQQKPSPAIKPVATTVRPAIKRSRKLAPISDSPILRLQQTTHRMNGVRLCRFFTLACVYYERFQTVCVCADNSS